MLSLHKENVAFTKTSFPKSLEFIMDPNSRIHSRSLKREGETWRVTGQTFCESFYGYFSHSQKLLLVRGTTLLSSGGLCCAILFN